MNLRDIWDCGPGAVIGSRLEDIDPGFVKDNRDYVYVDGEEGDHGVIRYYKDGVLMVIRTIHGGDWETHTLTDEGKAYVKQVMLDAVRLALDTEL